jgi:hypothetical protein
MELIQSNDGAVLRLKRHELEFLINAVNESLEALDDWEFQTRTGTEKEQARQILKALQEIRKSLRE